MNGDINQNQNRNLFHMIEKTQNSKVCIFDVDNNNINKLNSRGNDDKHIRNATS